VRDPEVADDLAQEFALRFLRGDFQRADPERGRCRDYLKRALINLVHDYLSQPAGNRHQGEQRQSLHGILSAPFSPPHSKSGSPLLHFTTSRSRTA
jgi:DNA-directed RNA polymerase specialized sigma24 family protein